MDRAAHAMITSGVTTVFHPLVYAKTLIQVGFEPMPPVSSTSIFGGKVLVYPNVLQYVGHIRRTDGFLGLYRGLTPRLFAAVIGTIVTNAVNTELVSRPMYTELVEGESGQVKPQNNDAAAHGIRKFLVDTTCESIARCAGAVITQPFHVICVRSMCQFVGRETKYSTVIGSFYEVVEHEGFVGLFSGLIPRLIGDLLTVWLANIMTYILNNLVVKSSSTPGAKEVQTYSNTFCQMAVSQLTYPFSVVSTVMCVNDSGLLASSLSHGPIYTSWTDCWSRLTKQGQLKRGSGFFWRLYKGPTQKTVDGHLVPAMTPSF